MTCARVLLLSLDVAHVGKCGLRVEVCGGVEGEEEGKIVEKSSKSRHEQKKTQNLSFFSTSVL